MKKNLNQSSTSLSDAETKISRVFPAEHKLEHTNLQQDIITPLAHIKTSDSTKTTYTGNVGLTATKTNTETFKNIGLDLSEESDFKKLKIWKEED